MSLSARDQHVLDEIEDGLADSAPELVSMLATFTRLTSSEEMPAGEAVAVAQRDARGVRALFRHPVAVLWVLIAVAMLTLAVAAIRGGNGAGCVKSWAVACASPSPAHSARPAREVGANRPPPAARPVPAAPRPAA